LCIPTAVSLRAVVYFCVRSCTTMRQRHTAAFKFCESQKITEPLRREGWSINCKAMHRTYVRNWIAGIAYQKVTVCANLLCLCVQRRAKSPSELGFNRYDVPRLKRALKSVDDKRTYQRIRAVLLVAQGRVITEVAEIVCVSLQTVYNWLSRYLGRHQIAALEEAPRSGRPLIAKQITKARILRELGRNPLRLGYSTTVWTVELLAHRLSDRYQ
jgi:transposase